MKIVSIIRNGRTILLTDAEIEAVYRAKEKQYAVTDAENHLKDFFTIEDDAKLISEGYADFTKTLGFTFNEACDEKSAHYMLSDLAERFLDKHDCNTPDNLQWDNIISRYCSKLGCEFHDAA